MAGPILKQDRRISWLSRSSPGDGGESSSSSGAKSSSSVKPSQPTIPEDEEEAQEAKGTMSSRKRQTSSLSPFLGPLVANSPQPLSDQPTPEIPADREITEVDYLTSKGQSAAPAAVKNTQAAPELRRGDSLDPRILTGMERLNVENVIPASASGVSDQLAAGSSSRAPVEDEGVLRKDTALDAEERNARLEILDKKEEERQQAAGPAEHGLREAMEQGSGKPFKVEWIRV